MPFAEILAPAIDPTRRQAIARVVTKAVCEALAIPAEIVTLYFVDIAADHYAHAGAIGSVGDAQRIFVKLHAFRRDVGARRRVAAAVTPLLADAYATPVASIAVYFIERDKDEVAHGGVLSFDALPV